MIRVPALMLLLTTATPAPAQMDHMAMPGHAAPASSAPVDATGTDLPPPATPRPAPVPPADHAADAVYPAAAMAAARARVRQEHGGMVLHQILFNLAEVQAGSGRARYRWDGEAWLGGDVDRLVLRSEGEGAFGRRLAEGEVQALYSRAVGPYFNLQGGIRQDIGRRPRGTYASVGTEGLAPYWIEVEGRLFLSTHGDLLARAEAWYDQRITQRLIAQPRVELNFAAQDVPARNLRSGLDTAELGLRLRYEVRRDFAPYMGVSWTHARGDGDGERGTTGVAGIRAWF